MSTTDIKLTFINKSNDTNNSSIVIFQKNTAASFNDLAVAWKVIENSQPGDSHPFMLPEEVQVSATDSYGNSTPQVTGSGQYNLVNTPTGVQLQPSGTGTDSGETIISNNLTQATINAHIYKNGQLLATKTGISPLERAHFLFSPTIWIGVESQVEQGQVMDSAIISNVNTQLSLLGIQEANIIMTGGGTGPGAQPYQFTLENV